MSSSYDSSYKLLYAHPAMIADLLSGFLPAEWVAELDLRSLQKVSGSYVSDDLRDREDDIIWRVRWGQEWLYVYLLLEFQSTVDAWMAVRIQTYVGLLYQDLIRTHQLTSERLLPPILPIVLYNGEQAWTAQSDVYDLVKPVPGLLADYRPRQRYLLLDEVRVAEAGNLPGRNLSAAQFRLEVSRAPAEVLEVLKALIEWLGAPEQAGLRRAFTVWLKRVFRSMRLPGVDFEVINDLHEVRGMLSERIDSWEKQWEQQGIEKGLQKGLQQGLVAERQLLLRQARKRFGADIVEQSQPLLDQIDDPQALEDLGEQLLDSADGDTWLRALRAIVGG